MINIIENQQKLRKSGGMEDMQRVSEDHSAESNSEICKRDAAAHSHRRLRRGGRAHSPPRTGSKTAKLHKSGYGSGTRGGRRPGGGAGGYGGGRASQKRMTAKDVRQLTGTGKLRIVAWDDTACDLYGHDPRSVYVEQFWLSILGPSTTWFLRICANRLDDCSELEADIGDIARTIGIGYGGGSAMERTIMRACHFHAARPAEVGGLEVRRRLPPLDYHQVRRLPESLRRRHDEYMASSAANDCISDHRRRARRLALGLFECGDSLDNAEMQLGRWQFNTAVAADAVRWAWKQYVGSASRQSCTPQMPASA